MQSNKISKEREMEDIKIRERQKIGSSKKITGQTLYEGMTTSKFLNKTYESIMSKIRRQLKREEEQEKAKRQPLK